MFRNSQKDKYRWGAVGVAMIFLMMTLLGQTQPAASPVVGKVTSDGHVWLNVNADCFHELDLVYAALENLHHDVVRADSTADIDVAAQVEDAVKLLHDTYNCLYPRHDAF